MCSTCLGRSKVGAAYASLGGGEIDKEIKLRAPCAEKSMRDHRIDVCEAEILNVGFCPCCATLIFTWGVDGMESASSLRLV